MTMRIDPDFSTAVVLIACHKDSPALLRTLASVRRESEDIPVLIVDDGAPEPLAHYADDPKVEVLRLDRNQGLTRALNAGLKRVFELDYSFVCRIDAGDENVPGRLREQLAYLKAHPDIWLVGSWADYVDVATGRTLFPYQPPAKADEVNRVLYRNSCVAHPTWMVRSALFSEIGLYDESFAVAQDYEFLRRAVASGFKIGNVPMVLLKYQVDPKGISLSRRREQLLARLRVQWRHRRPFAANKVTGMVMTIALLAIPYRVIAIFKQRVRA